LPPHALLPLGSVGKSARLMFGGWWRDRDQASALFDAAGAPVVEPTSLPTTERDVLRAGEAAGSCATERASPKVPHAAARRCARAAFRRVARLPSGFETRRRVNKARSARRSSRRAGRGATVAAACYVQHMKSGQNGSKNGTGKARARATPRQQAARKKYLELTGTKVSQERIAVIRAQWEG
jgi:hypothetical protein